MKAEIRENEIELIAETDFERTALNKLASGGVQSIRDKSHEDWSESANRGKRVVITFRDPNKW